MKGPSQTSALGRMRFVLARLSLKKRAGDVAEFDQDFEHLDEAFDPRLKLAPPLPRRGTPSWTRSETFQRHERSLVYVQHDERHAGNVKYNE